MTSSPAGSIERVPAMSDLDCIYAAPSLCTAAHECQPDDHELESRTAEILSQMRQDNAEAIQAMNAEIAARTADRAEAIESAIKSDRPVIHGAATSTGGTDRIPAERRSFTCEATALTGITLLDGITLLPDTAGSLSSLPEKLPVSVVSSFLSSLDWSYRGLDWSPPTLSETLRKVNPSTNHGGGRPRKVTVMNDEVRILTTPPARTAHGSLLHAAFRSTDEEVRSLHGNGRQSQMSDYHALRVQIATRRAQKAAARLAAASW